MVAGLRTGAGAEVDSILQFVVRRDIKRNQLMDTLEVGRTRRTHGCSYCGQIGSMRRARKAASFGKTNIEKRDGTTMQETAKNHSTLRDGQIRVCTIATVCACADFSPPGGGAP